MGEIMVWTSREEKTLAETVACGLVERSVGRDGALYKIAPRVFSLYEKYLRNPVVQDAPDPKSAAMMLALLVSAREFGQPLVEEKTLYRMVSIGRAIIG